MLRKVINFLFDSVYQVITWVWIAASISCFFFFAGKPSGERLQGMAWSAFSLCIAVFAMIALLAKRYFWDSGEEKSRPELYISDTRMMPLVPGQPETILLGIKNRGNGTARDIRLGGGNHFFASSSFNGPLEYKPVAVDTSLDLGSGEEKSMVSHSFEPLSEERIEQLQEGNLLFFHFAEGEYDDDAGKTYPIDYCFMYAPLTPTAMRVCPEKYWPKERKYRKSPGRPELFIEQVTFETFEVGKRETISLVIRNRGKSTARNVTIETTHAHTPASFEGPLTYKTIPADTHPDVGPDGVMTLISRSPWVTTIEHVHSVMEGGQLLFQYGRGHYADDWGNRYFIRFCYMFEPSFPRNMVVCPDRYCPKEGEDAKTA